MVTLRRFDPDGARRSAVERLEEGYAFLAGAVQDRPELAVRMIRHLSRCEPGKPGDRTAAEVAGLDPVELGLFVALAELGLGELLVRLSDRARPSRAVGPRPGKK